MQIHGFEEKYPGIVPEIRTQVLVEFPFDPNNPGSAANASQLPKKQYMALWDTGATGTCITQQVVQDLGLQPIGKVMCSHAQGQTMANRYIVNIGLPNKVRIAMLSVIEAQLDGGIDVLIGMDIISNGNFLVCNYGGKTTMSFAVPPHRQLSLLPSQKPQVASFPMPPGGRNAPCTCGSGKKWKKCHGAPSRS